MSPPRRSKLWLAVVFWSVGVLSCGPPESRNPLSDPAQAKADARLTGSWAGDLNGSEATLHLMPKTGASLDLVLVGKDDDKGAVVLTFDAFPTVLESRSYLNLRTKTFSGQYAESWQLGVEYTFARYELGKDGALTIWTMDDEPVRAAIAAGKLKGTAVGEGPVKLTAETKALADFVRAADHEKLFSRLGVFRKLR